MRSSSQNNRYSHQSQFNDSVQFEQDSITIQFRTQVRHTNVIFDKISRAPSLQRVLTGVYIKPVGIVQCSWLKHQFKIDSGACGNLMPLSMYKSLYNKSPSSNTVNSGVHLLDYNKQEITQLGTCHVSVRFRSTAKCVHFYIVPDRLKPIIGVSDAFALGLTSFHCPIYNDWQSNCNLTNSVDSIHSNANSTVHTGMDTANSTSQEFTMGTLTKQAILNHPKYPHLFSGIGHFKCKPVHITMKQNGTPIQKPPRKIPIAMKEKFKQELDSMESQGIISKFDGFDVSQEWSNSFVIVKKPSGALRICLDLRDLKKEIIRPVCDTHTMDNMVHKLKNNKYFAVLDTTKGFFHVPLDQESKLLTVILTPFGIFVYNVLAMGLSNVTDLFETCIREILQGLDGVTNITDDVLVFGTTYEELKSNVISF